jgi:RNA polymerase sigma-70 factor (ECF subfamily)
VSPPSAEVQRFEALYRAHYAAIVRFVHRRIDPASAEEIVAETFAIAWRRLDSVPADALPWLYVVARNLLRGERRSAARARHKAASFADAAKLDRGRDPADAFAEREHVLRAFSALPERDREALRLVAWEGLDHRDAARVFGTSRVAFAMRVSRARRRLAAALADADQRADLSCNQAVGLLEGQA